MSIFAATLQVEMEAGGRAFLPVLFEGRDIGLEIERNTK